MAIHNLNIVKWDQQKCFDKRILFQIFCWLYFKKHLEMLFQNVCVCMCVCGRGGGGGGGVQWETLASYFGGSNPGQSPVWVNW